MKQEDFNFTPTPYINKKYKQFYEKKEYIPEMFNPYNCSEILDYAPTLSTNCGSTSCSASVLIIESDFD